MLRRLVQVNTFYPPPAQGRWSAELVDFVQELITQAIGAGINHPIGRQPITASAN
jgi:hypothetical protein